MEKVAIDNMKWGSSQVLRKMTMLGLSLLLITSLFLSAAGNLLYAAPTSTASTTTISASAVTVLEGESITFTATIGGAPSHTTSYCMMYDPMMGGCMMSNYTTSYEGKVEFFNGAVSVEANKVLTTSDMMFGVIGSTASTTISNLSAGTHTIKAEYSGYDDDYEGTYFNVASSSHTITVTVIGDTVNSIIDSTTASFDKNAASDHYADVETTLTLNGNTLSSIVNDSTELVLDDDYTIVDNVVTISEGYLARQAEGTTSLVFNFSAGDTQTLTITISDTTPATPNAPELLSAVSGDSQVSLSWNPVAGASGYNVYKSNVSGVYEMNTASVTSSVYSYDVTGLTNGTTYYFVVRAINVSVVSEPSNEMSATPATEAVPPIVLPAIPVAPAVPTGVAAVAGNGNATISFTVPADDGGSAITSYVVTSSPGNITTTGTASPIIVNGLTNGTSYTFTVKAVNSVGTSAASGASSAITPTAPVIAPPVIEPEPDPEVTEPEVTEPEVTEPEVTEPEPDTAAEVIVNGKAENAGTARTTTVNDRTVTTITIDQQKLEERLANEGQRALISIPVNTQSDVVIGELNGEMVGKMEQKQASIEIRTGRAVYTLPAQQINIQSISNQLGESVDLKDIAVQIEIATPSADTLQIVQNASGNGQFSIIAPPLNFTVKGVYKDKTIDITTFNSYIKRSITIPDDVDPNTITTGIVVEPNGIVRHVPTKIIQIDGKYYAQVKSLTNSTYTVVGHPIEFKDVAKHWAKNVVNDMGSRMVISGDHDNLFNPDQAITRAEFISILVRGLGLKLENGETPFTDIHTSAWYSSAIHTAYTYKLINGFEDGKFHPSDPITREEAMVLIANAMNITDLTATLGSRDVAALLGAYRDAHQVALWTEESIADVLQAGIVTGRGNNLLALKAHMTRAEVAVIIQKLLQKSELI